MHGPAKRQAHVLVGLPGEWRVDLSHDTPLLAFMVDDHVDECLRSEILDDANPRGNLSRIANDHRLRAEAECRRLAAQRLAEPDLGAANLKGAVDRHWQ